MITFLAAYNKNTPILDMLDSISVFLSIFNFNYVYTFLLFDRMTTQQL